MLDPRQRLLDILRSDIYTDAPEYADRVAEIPELLAEVFDSKPPLRLLTQEEIAAAIEPPPPEFENWGTPQQFDRCAKLILDAVEQAFDLLPCTKEGQAYAALLAILKHYCLPNPNAWVPPAKEEFK